MVTFYCFRMRVCLLTAALCMGLPAVQAAAADAPGGAQQDKVVLENGTVRYGRIYDYGRNHIELETSLGTEKILKRKIKRVQIGRAKEAQESNLERVRLRGGGEVAGEVHPSTDGKFIVVRVPGVGEVRFPKEDVQKVIRKGQDRASRPVAGPEELKLYIEKLLKKLEGSGLAAKKAERELRQLGIFALERLGAAEKKASGRKLERIRAILKDYEIQKLVGSKLDEELPGIYEKLQSEDPQERINALKAGFLVAPKETTELVLFLVESPREVESVRSFCVEVLRRLNRYRDLVEIYNRAEGSLELAVAVALCENGIYIGLPAIISALTCDSPPLRSLAHRKLAAYTGKDFLSGENLSDKEWKEGREKYVKWWEEHKRGIVQATKALVSGEPEASPQRARALQYWRKGDQHRRNGEYREAERAFARALSIDPSSARAALSLGVLLYRFRDKDREAREALDRIIKGRYPDTPMRLVSMARYHMGMLEDKLGNYGESVKQLERAIELREDYVNAYLALGDVYYRRALTGSGLRPDKRRRFLSEAEKAYRKGLSQLNRYEEGLVVLPYEDMPVGDDIGFRRRDYVRSLKKLQAVIKEKKNSLRVNLIRVYIAGGELAKAEKEAREALEESSDNANLQLLLAIVFEREGDKEAALRHYRATLRLDPQNEAALQAKRRLLANR